MAKKTNIEVRLDYQIQFIIDRIALDDAELKKLLYTLVQLSRTRENVTCFPPKREKVLQILDELVESEQTFRAWKKR